MTSQATQSSGLSIAILAACCAGTTAWQLDFKWGWSRYCAIDDVLSWCEKYHDHTLAKQSKEWFERERTKPDPRQCNQYSSLDFWRVFDPHTDRPVKFCTIFQMHDEDALNVEALLALQSTQAVPPVLWCEGAEYMAKSFRGHPFPEVNMGPDPPNMAGAAYDEMISRIWRGLDAIHAAGWTLGVIKPESIFVDVRSRAIWEDDIENKRNRKFVSQDFEVYFVYLGQASARKANLEQRVAADCASLARVVGPRP